MMDAILAGLSDGVIVVDGRGSVTVANPRALSIFGCDADIIGRKLSYLMPLGELADALTEGRAAVFETDRAGRIYLVRVQPLECGNNLAVLSDVTENREHTRRREEFFANASHELKTPLTAIIGFAEILAANAAPDQRELTEKITRQSARMRSLVEGMLELAKLEGGQPINPAPCELAAAIHEILSDLESAIHEREVLVKLTGTATVQAEAAHLYDLLKNIIENAVRYNKQGGKIRIKITRNTLTVRDTGIGISHQDQSKIFERFYRVEKSRTTGGSGLGLSIAKHVCHLYGWRLSLRSKPEVGTEVRVEF
jgi:two-component system phosphate regulon sensor histidine kinase PhoR